METFTFALYSVSPGQYPTGDVLTLGKGHQVGVKPLLPIQRTHVLEFSALKWFQDVDGTFVNDATPTQNILALIEFYERHQMWKRFIFVHEVYGSMIVRFKEPFSPPKALPGGTGWTAPFELTFIEQVL